MLSFCPWVGSREYKININFCDNAESFSIFSIKSPKVGVVRGRGGSTSKFSPYVFIPNLIEGHYSHHDENKCFYFLIFSAVLRSFRVKRKM